MASETGTSGEASRPGAASAALVGKSVTFKGELEASEDLTIEGQVEGKIELRDHTLTIGPGGRAKAQVFAKFVVVCGEVVGNVNASEAVEIRESGSVEGDIASPKVAIASGAHFRGSIDMQQKAPAPAKGAAAAPESPSPWKIPPSYGA